MCTHAPLTILSQVSSNLQANTSGKVQEIGQTSARIHPSGHFKILSKPTKSHRYFPYMAADKKVITIDLAICTFTLT